MLRHVSIRLLGDERGVTLVEYGIAVTLAIVIGTAGFVALGGAVNGQMNAAATEMTDN